MFTVIICDEHIINDCHNKYYIYLKPFLDNTEFAFCKWDVSGSSLDEAVPELKETVETKNEWRAIIVNDSSTWNFDAVNKRNPFNYVDSINTANGFNTGEQIEEFRKKEDEMLEKAFTNPLMKLSVWLCGSPIEAKPNICYAGFEEVVENISDEKEYYKKAEELSVTAQEIELDRIRLMRFDKLSQIFGNDVELFNPPHQVLALTERTKDVRREIADSVWVKHMEHDYSQFYHENLYSEKLRYLICDVSYLKGKHNEAQYFNFLTVMLLMAVNESPSGVLRANRVYSLNVKIDADCVKELCNQYNSKLNATLCEISNESRRLMEKENKPVERDDAEVCFETGVTIPVNVDSFFDEDNLMARYDEIGLAKDCPNDEGAYWNDQYNTIEKMFVKYLREPRRAVKVAVKDCFPAVNKNEDERASRLNEFQKENVLDFLNEEEQNMISTKTTHLYNTAEYKQQMEEADKVIRRGISQRMTKKKTIKVAVIAASAYFFGFIPLFIGNLNNTSSFLFSLGMSGITMALFLLVGLCTLFVFKNRLVNRIKHFNYVMSGIVGEIQDSLHTFSTYLSSACNVMREFSVLELTENTYEKKQNILKNHRRIILKKIKEVNELFASYIDNGTFEANRTVQPYDFDFAVMEEYQYEMPYSEMQKSIVFMQEGNEIVVPVDYLEAVIAEREELYD